MNTSKIHHLSIINNKTTNQPFSLNTFITNSNNEKETEKQIISSKIPTEQISLNTTSISKNNIDTENTNDLYYSNFINNHIQLLHSRGCVTITNVYQETYKNNTKATGFGDFLRGCYYLLYFCNKYHFTPNVIINHPLSIYLKHNLFYNPEHNNNNNNNNNNNILNNIYLFNKNNINEIKYDNNNTLTKYKTDHYIDSNFISYLNSNNIYNNTIFVYIILFTDTNIKTEHKTLMRKLLEPNLIMKELLSKTMLQLNITPKNYYVIHIRSGDKFLTGLEHRFTLLYCNQLETEINLILSNLVDVKDILIICDNNTIKYFLKEKFPDFKYLFNEITHFGENTKLNNELVKNTMLDFYLLSKSMFIYSLSSYEHGSGFSLWCSITYDIPYKCKFIQNN